MRATPLPPILAQAEPVNPTPALKRFSEVSENFNGQSLISPHWLFILAGALLLLLSGLSIMRWWKHRNEHARPLMVFTTTARMAGLSYADQLALFLIARHRSLASPLSLMLSPGTFDHHVKAYLDARPGWRREAVRRRTQSIRESLFANLHLHHDASAA